MNLCSVLGTDINTRDIAVNKLERSWLTEADTLVKVEGEHFSEKVAIYIFLKEKRSHRTLRKENCR